MFGKAMKGKKTFLSLLFFFVSLLILGVLSAGGAGYYYYRNLKSGIEENIKEKISSMQALSSAAAISLSIENSEERNKKLSSFFSDPVNTRLYMKAFIVSDDGKIVAHSNEAEAKELNYNIASDEFRYDGDIIFKPLRISSGEAVLSDYHIIGEKIPFSAKEILYIKKYLYDGIDRNGWIVSRGVTVENIKDGKKTAVNYAVCFILSKNRLFEDIMKTRSELLKAMAVCGIVSAAASFVLTLIFAAAVSFRSSEKNIADSGIAKNDNRDTERIILYDDDNEDDCRPQVILDAIPIRKRR